MVLLKLISLRKHLETPVISPEKIEEWLQEAVERPQSAPVIIQFICNRLRDLTARNEELLAENIALMTDKRVEEYEQRIAHLEYQLDLLRRQFGGDLALTETGPAAERANEPMTLCLILFHTNGKVLRLNTDVSGEMAGVIGRLQGELMAGGEAPHLLVVAPSEELLLIFSSGRVSTIPAGSLPVARSSSGEAGIQFDWDQAPTPEEPRAGETLVAVAPISKMALAEYLLQPSRRGYVKKIRAQLAQSILANHYIGTGVKMPADRTFALVLSSKDDRLVLVTWEGYLQCLDVRRLSFSIEGALRLNPTDHLKAAFTIAGVDSAQQSRDLPAPEQRSILIMTQGGKAVHWTEADIETASSTKTRGQPVFSAQRRSQGARVVGAALVRESDWAAGLAADGTLSLHPLAEILNRGTLPVEAELLAFTCFPVAGKSKAR